MLLMNILLPLQCILSVHSYLAESVIPHGRLAKQALQSFLFGGICDSAIYRSCQAVVTTGDADFDTLSEGAAKLREVAVAGDAVSFLSPTQMGKIAAGGLAKFIPDDIQKKIYSKNYLGEYAGASQVECQGLPKITTPSAMNLTVSLTDVSGIGFAQTIQTYHS